MQLSIKKRTIQGKKVKQLRKQWIIPWIMYGKHLKWPLKVQCLKNEFLKLYKQVWTTTPIKLKWEWVDQMVMIHEIDVEPVRSMLINIDFLAIQMDEKIESEVPVIIKWEEIMSKQWLWTELVKSKIKVSALPSDIPREIVVDFSVIAYKWDNINIKDLSIAENIEILDDENVAVVVVFDLKKIEEAELAKEKELETKVEESTEETDTTEKEDEKNPDETKK